MTKEEKIEFIKKELEQSYIDYSSTHDEEEMRIIHEVFRFWLEHHESN